MSQIPSVLMEKEIAHHKLGIALKHLLEISELKLKLTEEVAECAKSLKEDSEEYKKEYEKLPQEIKDKLRFKGMKET